MSYLIIVVCQISTAATSDEHEHFISQYHIWGSVNHSDQYSFEMKVVTFTLSTTFFEGGNLSFLTSSLCVMY